MKILKLSIVISLAFLFKGCAQNKEINFLIGVWKVENKESYEEWSKSEDNLVGKAYKIKNGDQRVSENLEIKFENDKIIYIATVLNQNQGKGIPFVLNTSKKELISFENLEHDFPKKIQYEQLNGHELHVWVLGENDKGFSYKMIKQNK